jgi:hypothetical protein
LIKPPKSNLKGTAHVTRFGDPTWEVQEAPPRKGKAGSSGKKDPNVFSVDHETKINLLCADACLIDLLFNFCIEHTTRDVSSPSGAVREINDMITYYTEQKNPVWHYPENLKTYPGRELDLAKTVTRRMTENMKNFPEIDTHLLTLFVQRLPFNYKSLPTLRSFDRLTDETPDAWVEAAVENVKGTWEHCKVPDYKNSPDLEYIGEARDRHIHYALLTDSRRMSNPTANDFRKEIAPPRVKAVPCSKDDQKLLILEPALNEDLLKNSPIVRYAQCYCVPRTDSPVQEHWNPEAMFFYYDRYFGWLEETAVANVLKRLSPTTIIQNEDHIGNPGFDTLATPWLRQTYNNFEALFLESGGPTYLNKGFITPLKRQYKSEQIAAVTRELLRGDLSALAPFRSPLPDPPELSSEDYAANH